MYKAIIFTLLFYIITYSVIKEIHVQRYATTHTHTRDGDEFLTRQWISTVSSANWPVTKSGQDPETKTKAISENLIYYGTNATIAEQYNTEAMFQKYSNPEDPSQVRRFPRVICVGIFKAGTDALSAFLDIHPRIARCPREALYFQLSTAGQNYEDYLWKMPYSSSEQLTYEKSPMYATGGDHLIYRKIYEFDPSVKILFLVRDPIVRVMSGFLHTYANRKDVGSFEVRSCYFSFSWYQ